VTGAGGGLDDLTRPPEVEIAETEHRHHEPERGECGADVVAKALLERGASVSEQVVEAQARVGEGGPHGARRLVPNRGPQPVRSEAVVDFAQHLPIEAEPHRVGNDGRQPITEGHQGRRAGSARTSRRRRPTPRQRGAEPQLPEK
jgi:hypothetical protein